MLTEALRGQYESRSRRNGTAALFDGPFCQGLRNATFRSSPPRELRPKWTSENAIRACRREDDARPAGADPDKPSGHGSRHRRTIAAEDRKPPRVSCLMKY